MASTKYYPIKSSPIKRSTKRRSPIKRSTKRRSPIKRSTKRRSPIKRSTKKKSICWKGYHRVKGTVPYSKGSCAKD
jgi:hypothetical protein